VGEGSGVRAIKGGFKMPEDPKLAEEIKKMEYEPLNSAEKKLITYNLVIGVILLAVLIWVNHTFFPVQG
jgi:hypothetical protein